MTVDLVGTRCQVHTPPRRLVSELANSQQLQRQEWQKAIGWSHTEHAREGERWLAGRGN